MCWDYSECGNCGKTTPCTAYCGCDGDFYCTCRDCKSFERCSVCSDDLCEDCDSPCEICSRVHCIDHSCQAAVEESETSSEESESSSEE